MYIDVGDAAQANRILKAIYEDYDLVPKVYCDGEHCTMTAFFELALLPLVERIRILEAELDI